MGGNKVKKILTVIFAALYMRAIAACVTCPPDPRKQAQPQLAVQAEPELAPQMEPQKLAEENPKIGPEITVRIPELFSPDPNKSNDEMTIRISVTHTAAIKEWDIFIQPNLQSGHTQQGLNRNQTNRPRRGRAFFEQSGTGSVPTEWKWNGKSSSGE
jgi:hypothetical protein